MLLEPAEFDLLWRRLALPAKPLVLNVPAQGATVAEAAQLAEHAADALRGRDLLTGDEPAARVAGMLNLVGRPAAHVDVRWSRGVGLPELRGMVALRGKHGVLALWDGRHVRLRRVRHDVFAAELVGVLDEMPAGGGRSVTAPSDVILCASRGSAGDAARFERKLIAGGVSRDDARLWRDIACAPRVRAGQIGASGFDRWGKPTRAPWVIHVLDTDRGRYATYERRGYRTVVGATTNWLVTVVQELYGDAVRNR